MASMMFDNGFATYMIQYNMKNKEQIVDVKRYHVQRNLGIICLIGIFGLCGVALYTSSDIGETTVNKVEFHDYIDDFKGSGYNKSYLPSNLLPISYTLYLHPNIERKSYTGNIMMKILCQDQTSEVIIHSLQHKIKDIKVKHKGKEIEIKSFYRSKYGILKLELNQNLTAGEIYELSVDFYNNLVDGLSSGIYLDKFIDGNGKLSELMMTNFGHGDARKAWPCFDEPSLEATWKILIKHPRTINVISNMAVEEQKIIDDENVESKFAVTPKMRSSNVAVVVTPYEYKTIESPLKTKINVYAPAGRLHETNFAIKLAPLAVDAFSQNLKLKPTSKLDFIPVSSSNVKQKFGVIPAVESLLLYDSTTTSVQGLENIADKILHEISKQWFGDLMDDSWLKKALASYMKDAALQKFFPSWNLQAKFYSSVVEKALKTDSNLNFISPEKGTALVNMLAKMLGNDGLFKGFRAYLNKHKSDNSGITHVWESITKVTYLINVSVFMNLWTNQTGFPLITLKLVGNTLSIKQESFGYKNSSTETAGKADNSLWHVPITIKMCGKVFHIMLKKKSEKVHVQYVCGNKAFKANFGTNGYYRVNYDDKNWSSLLKLLNTNNKLLPAVDRANLLADAYSLVQHNQATVKLLLDLTQYLRKEHEFVPWEIGSKILTDLGDMFNDTPLKNCIEEYTVKLIDPVIDYLNTFKTHSHPQKKLVVLMLNVALKHKMEPVTSTLQTLFWKWMLSGGRKPLPGYIRESIIRAGVMRGNEEEWKFIHKMYKNAKSVGEKKMFLKALTYTSNPKLLDRLVQYAQNFTHEEDQISVLIDMCSNPVGKDLVLNAAKFCPRYQKLLSAAPDSFMHLLNECLGSGSSPADLAQAKEFKPLVKPGMERSVDQVMERIKLNMELRKKEKDVATWFQKKLPSCFRKS